MKTAIVLALALFASQAALAASPTPKEGDFEARKSEILSRIDERIKRMQDHRGCVAASTDHEGLKKCREQMREYMEDKREEWKEKRQDRREKRRD
jgi:imidazolonepropionase-like amidohydrolase